MDIGEYIKMKDMLNVIGGREKDKIKGWEKKEMVARLENYSGFVKEQKLSQFRRILRIPIYEPIRVVQSRENIEISEPKIQDYEFFKVLKETRNKVEFLYKQVI